MIYFNILSLVESWLDALGVLTTCMATIVIVDYYIVRKKMSSEANQRTLESVNMAGIADTCYIYCYFSIIKCI